MTPSTPATTPPHLLQRIRNWLRSDMRILRWVFLGLYLLLITGLSLPFLTDVDPLIDWLMLFGVFSVGQALFIFGAGTIQLCRPIRKRRLWMPVVVAATMLLILVIGLAMALGELFYLHTYLEDTAVTVFWSMVFGSWFLWAVLLWAYTQRWRRMRVLSHLAALLFAGSLAELIAAVPSHVIVSKRPGCLVGIGTLFGIMAGIYAMLFSFGPAIVVLFLRPRYRREQMEADPRCQHCDYNLRGTLAAGRRECPECGTAVATADVRANGTS